MDRRDFIERLQRTKLEQQGTELWGGYVNMLKQLTSVFDSPRHWIMEFLQNAEDAEASVLGIHFDGDELWILNNGKPFTEEDVKALCDVNSRKKPAFGHRGYIGIGFKSIFHITDAIEIHSSEYHFKFDRNYWKDKNLTIWPWEILPIPIEPKQLPEEESKGFKTGFLIKKNYLRDTEVQQDLSSFFLDLVDRFPMEALLQLTKVREISFRLGQRIRCDLTKEEKYREEMTDIGVTEEHLITSKKGPDGTWTERYLVVRKKVSVPKEVREDRETIRAKRDNVDRSEIGLIFKQGEDGPVKVLRGTISGVYSFLPVEGEQTGLPFAIFGDFIPHPARYVIFHSAKWNQWLCGEIRGLFRDFVTRKVQADAGWVSVPALILTNMHATGSIRDFWQEHLYEPIRKFLEEGSLYPDQGGELRRLSELVLVADDLKPLADDLAEACGKHLPDDKTAEILQKAPQVDKLNTYEVLTNEKLLSRLRKNKNKLRTLYRSIGKLSDYYIRGRRSDPPLWSRSFVLDRSGQLRRPSEVVVAKLDIPEEIKRLPFLKHIVDSLRWEKLSKLSGAYELDPDIAEDDEAVRQLKRCDLKVEELSRDDLFAKLYDEIRRIKRREDCPRQWSYPADLIEATLYLLSLTTSKNVTLERLVSRDGELKDTRFLFAPGESVPGVILDWSYLEKKGCLRGLYHPIHEDYWNDQILERYGLTREGVTVRLVKASGVHGFERKQDSELVAKAAEEIARKWLVKQGHNPQRASDTKGIGYDFYCEEHCDKVFEIKGKFELSDIELEGSEAEAAVKRGKNYILILVYNLPGNEKSPPKLRLVEDPGRAHQVSVRIMIAKDVWDQRPEYDFL